MQLLAVVLFDSYLVDQYINFDVIQSSPFHYFKKASNAMGIFVISRCLMGVMNTLDMNQTIY
jgi:hypothetical protein